MMALPSWSVVSPERLAHIRRVVALIEGWCMRMEVPVAHRERWLRAAWLHDALRDAPAADLARLAGTGEDEVALLHGPAAATRAAALGETDPGVLDAVRYHSVGYAGWDMTGRVLYAADFLEPGRNFDRATRAELAERFPDSPGTILREVARRRMQWLVASGWRIPESTWSFWNSLALGAGK